MTQDLEIILPFGALGASEYDSPFDASLRAIAVAASADPQTEWAEKYGTEFENDIFLMHPFCWCERDDCRWCSEDACGCQHDDPEGWLDGERVSSWWEANTAIIGDVWKFDMTPQERENWEARVAERDRRLKQVWPERVHSCQPVGLMADRARGDTWLPRQSAPHFWHKPSGFKVWWYKYIGRDMDTVGTPPADLVAQCLASISG